MQDQILRRPQQERFIESEVLDKTFKVGDLAKATNEELQILTVELSEAVSNMQEQEVEAKRKSREEGVAYDLHWLKSIKLKRNIYKSFKDLIREEVANRRTIEIARIIALQEKPGANLQKETRDVALKVKKREIFIHLVTEKLGQTAIEATWQLAGIMAKEEIERIMPE